MLIMKVIKENIATDKTAIINALIPDTIPGCTFCNAVDEVSAFARYGVTNSVSNDVPTIVKSPSKVLTIPRTKPTMIHIANTMIEIIDITAIVISPFVLYPKRFRLITLTL